MNDERRAELADLTRALRCSHTPGSKCIGSACRFYVREQLPLELSGFVEGDVLESCDSDAIGQEAAEAIELLVGTLRDALDKQPKWISVKEQPNPPEDGEYWCHGYWLKSGRKQTESAEYLGEWKIANNFILTHWMPLPEPPKEDA